MKYCPYCGTQLQDDMIFCRKCGRKYPSDESNELDSGEATADGVNSTGKQDRSNVVCKEAPATVDERPQNKNRNKMVLLFVVAICAVAILSGAIVMIVSILARQKPIEDNAQPAMSSSPQSEQSETPGSTMSIAEASESVLYLEIYDDHDELVGTASGFLVGDHSTLVTNYHVMEDAYHIVAWTADGEHYGSVTHALIYDKRTDLAVLRCADPMNWVEPLELMDSDQLNTGDSVYAVSYPLGLNNTISDGIVSSRYKDENGTEIIQTTAAISEGSSGGVLFQEDGRVVGVTCASYVEGQNINLAISSNELSRLLHGERKAQSLASRYDSLHQYGLSPANLSGDGYVADTDSLLFTVEENNAIYMQDKHTGLREKIATGKWINVYKECLYYYDTEANEICCYDLQTQAQMTVFQFLKEETTSMSGYSRFYETAGEILLAENSIFLRLDYRPSFDDVSGWESYLAVIDLENPSDFIYISADTITNFTYNGSTIYAGVSGRNEILKLDMKTLAESYLEIGFEASMQGSDQDNVYFLDNYNSENGVLYYVAIEEPDYVQEKQFLDKPLENGLITYYIDGSIYCAVWTHDGQYLSSTTDIYQTLIGWKLMPVQKLDIALSFSHCGTAGSEILFPLDGVSITIE